MRAASFDGPKQAMPAARTASATPSTSGTSGPMTTRSIASFSARAVTASAEVTSTSCCSATAAVPALPGATARKSTCGVVAQPQQQGVFAGTGSDHEDAHRHTLDHQVSTNRRSGGRSPRAAAAVRVAAISPRVSAGSITSSISNI